jgi:membrane protease subunit HflK
MPWDNNTGGGGRNNNSGGPWGQAPGGGGGGGGGNNRRPGNTPNLEDLLARGRDRFQGGVPGGRWAIVGVVLAAVAFWGFNSVYVINSNEVGVVTLFGKPKEDVALEGLHFLLWPIEQVERVPRTENQIVIGSTNGRAQGQQDGLMLSGDSNIADVRFSVLWQVANPIDFLYNVRNPEDLVQRTAESAMREVVGRRPVQDIFRDDQAGILAEVQQISQQVLDSYGAGVTVNQVTFDNAQPPAEVADAFNEVQRAEQDEDRLQEEARTYANTLLGNARGEAARIREDAAAYKQQVTLEAQGEAARFISVYNEYVNNPDVTRKRLYLETMELVLGGANKVIMDEGSAGSGVIPYLPLPAIQPGATNSGNAGTTGTSNTAGSN